MVQKVKFSVNSGASFYFFFALHQSQGFLIIILVSCGDKYHLMSMVDFEHILLMIFKSNLSTTNWDWTKEKSWLEILRCSRITLWYMLLSTILMFLWSNWKFYIIWDYVMTLEYILTNVDYIHVSSLIDDHILANIVCDPYY
jgi:hypothetical protein